MSVCKSLFLSLFFLGMVVHDVWGEGEEYIPWSEPYIDALARSWPENRIENIPDTLVQSLRSKQQIRVVHVGDSHLQAGYSSRAMRGYWARCEGCANAARGFLFPFAALGSHDSYQMRSYPSKAWVGLQSLRSKQVTGYGLCCAYLENRDASRSLFMRLYPDSLDIRDSQELCVLYEPNSDYIPLINGAHPEVVDSTLGVATFPLKGLVRSVELGLSPVSSTRRAFRLWGVILRDTSAWIDLYSTGLNGADVETYNRNLALPHQLHVLEPDVVIISLGTNDAYSTGFKAEQFTLQLRTLVQSVRCGAPDALIVLTTPNDHLYRRRELNSRVGEVSELIRMVSIEEGLGLWDFHSIMGGAGSIYSWFNHGLVAGDYLHLTVRGYTLQGVMLGDALYQLLRAE